MKNRNNFECPICQEVVYSEIGKGCKMCGMPIKDGNEEFCSKSCKIKYLKINLMKNEKS